MKKIYLVALAAVLSSFVACSDATKDTKQGAFIVANNFSDAEWKNGVLQKDGKTNEFYYLQEAKDPIKLKVGDTLTFAKSGKAKVVKVDSTTPNQNGQISVFVTVDKNLDPIGDGYPNKIE